MASTATAHRIPVVRPGPWAPVDLAVTAVVFAGSLALLARGGAGPAHPGSHALDLAGVVLVACVTMPLLAWRRFPLTVFAASAAGSTLLAGLGYPVDLPLAPAAALYLFAARRDRQTLRTGATAAATVGLFAAFLSAIAVAQQTFPGIELLHAGLAWAVAWFAGESTRLRRERLAELSERVFRAERASERERLLAVAEERARIARDLHDSAGHAISVIAVRAGAARLRHHHDPDRSLHALCAVEQLARRTAQEIDQIVGTLREGQPANNDIQAPPGLGSLDTLIAHHRAAGLDVALDTVGTPRPLAGAVDQAAYRILQESLRNAAHHGTGSARITLGYAGTAVEITVTNPTPTGGRPRSGGGHGLIGMRERATLLGGSLHTHRTTEAFRVHARIPYAGHST